MSDRNEHIGGEVEGRGKSWTGAVRMGKRCTRVVSQRRDPRDEEVF